MNQERIEKVVIVIDQKADAPQRFAAEVLCRHLGAMFALQVVIDPTWRDDGDAAIILGTRDANSLLETALGPAGWPRISEQGFLLRKTEHHGRPCMLIAGGSGAAVLWSACELLEMLGVRFTLHEDVLPDDPGPFVLPQIDRVFEPQLRTRAWRQMNLFPMGPESWGLPEHRTRIRQLAKLKFNTIYAQLWPYQPFVHFECGGISKRTGTQWFGWEYRVDGDTIGKEHFDGMTVFSNPQFVGCDTYEEMLAAGTDLIHGIFAESKAMGMTTAIAALVTAFPREFKPLLKHALEDDLYAYGTDPDEPALHALMTNMIRAYCATYPECDRFIIDLPEWHKTTSAFEPHWHRLDAKYGIGRRQSRDQLMSLAASATTFPGGAGRVVGAVKGNIVLLSVLDKLLTEDHILGDIASVACAGAEGLDADAAGTKLGLMAVHKELFPILDLIVPADTTVQTHLEYGSNRSAWHVDALAGLGAMAPRTNVVINYQDDNIGVMPQLCTDAIETLVRGLCEYGLCGFFSKTWMTGDLAPALAYIARAPWQPQTTTQSTHADYSTALFGEAAADEAVRMYELLMKVTDLLGEHALSYGFPVREMMTQFWDSGEPPTEYVEQALQWYRDALAHARNVVATCRPAGHPEADYNVGRLEFAVEFIEARRAYAQAAVTYKQAQASNDRADVQRALSQCEHALTLSRDALQAYARVVRDGSDKGALAQLNDDFYRAVGRTVSMLRAERDAPPG